MSKIKINKLVKAGLSRNMVSQLSEREMDVLIQKFILNEQTTMVPARDQATIKKLKDDLLKSEVDIDEWKKEDVKRVIEEMNLRLGSRFEAEEILNKIGEEKPLFFESVILVAIIYRKPLYCLVNQDGRYIVYSPRGHHAFSEAHSVFHDFMSQPFFSLSLTEAYKELVCDWAPKKFMANISILSNTEHKIL